MGRLLSIVMLGVLLSSAAFAKTLTEASIMCDNILMAKLDSQGAAHLFATCATYDGNGNLVRARREYDVTSQLSAPQKSGLLSILQNLALFVDQDQSIPTPTPTSTP